MSTDLLRKILSVLEENYMQLPTDRWPGPPASLVAEIHAALSAPAAPAVPTDYAKLRMIFAHWNEFGPEAGFAEMMERWETAPEQAAPVQAVPEGMVMVPREPTPQMSGILQWFDRGSPAQIAAGWEKVLAAALSASHGRMLSASPAPPTGQAEPILREAADALLDAGHKFWKACRRDAGGGAVRWLDATDGTLIVFTRGEYRDTIMRNIDTILGIPVVRFEDDESDDKLGITAVEKASSGQAEAPVAVAQPVAQPVGAEEWANKLAAAIAEYLGGYIGGDSTLNKFSGEPHWWALAYEALCAAPGPTDAAPPSAPAKPLTRDEIEEIAGPGDYYDRHVVARAIERAVWAKCGITPASGEGERG